MLLELSLYAQGLKNVAGAFRGTSDPFAVVTQLAVNPHDQPKVLGKTEVIHNTLSPSWTTVFRIEYNLGTPVKVAVSVFDQESKRDNKPMGSVIFDIGELLGARGNTKAKRPHDRKGTIVAHVRPVEGSGTLQLKLKGVGLKNVEGMFSKSDPFFEMSRQINAAGGATWDNIFRSKAVKNNLNPVWEESTLELSTLCGGNLDQPVLLSVFDFESNGKHKSMGRLETTVNFLLRAASSQSELVLMQKGKPCGKIVVTSADVTGILASASNVSKSVTSVAAQVSQMTVCPDTVSRSNTSLPSFADYVSGGCGLNVTVAIDFTGSNGNPRTPGTLHYMDKNSKNDYEKAISAIVGILQQFDDDQQYEVLGFGAKFGGTVRHNFQVGPSPTVHGVEGILNAYNHVFESGLILSSPTVFTEVIRHAATRAQETMDAAQKQNGSLAYSILLILTDGAVSDVQATAACLRSISSCPLSIVIVGVGKADFSAMQFLDDCNGSSSPHRDLVQFVSFRDHSHSAAELTQATLQEIPVQLEQCFHVKNYKAGPAIVVKDEDIVVESEEEIDLSLNIGDEGDVVVGSGGVLSQPTFYR